MLPKNIHFKRDAVFGLYGPILKTAMPYLNELRYSQYIEILCISSQYLNIRFFPYLIVSDSVQVKKCFARCTESINSVHTVNNCTCMSVHFYNIMPTFVN